MKSRIVMLLTAAALAAPAFAQTQSNVGDMSSYPAGTSATAGTRAAAAMTGAGVGEARVYAGGTQAGVGDASAYPEPTRSVGQVTAGSHDHRHPRWPTPRN